MAEKDIAEKILEDYPDVFADIVNGLLFNGEPVIKPEELEDSKIQSAYRAEGGLHELERDVAKRWKKNDIRIVADYFAQKRKTGMYTGTKDEIRHVEALLQLLFVMEKDDRFEQAYVEEKRKGGIRNMCDVIDHYLKIGEEKGVLIGLEKGRDEGEAKTIYALFASGMSPEEIAARLKKDVADVKAAIQKYSMA